MHRTCELFSQEVAYLYYSMVIGHCDVDGKMGVHSPHLVLVALVSEREVREKGERDGERERGR